MKKRFPVRSEVFRGDGFFVSQRHIFPRFALPLVNTPQIHLPESVLHRARIPPSISSFIIRHPRATLKFALTGA